MKTQPLPLIEILTLLVLGGLFMLAWILVAGCRPSLPVEPSVTITDAGDSDGPGTPIGEACKQLRIVGCPEGSPNFKGRTCYQSLSIAASYAPLGPDGGRFQTVPAECLIHAQSIIEVRTCGSLNEVRVRCLLNEAGAP